MSYLNDIQAQISNRDFTKFMQLWEEYCASDHIDIEEFASILQAIKASDFAKPFGQYIETAIPLLSLIPSEEESYRILRLLIDLQTSNSVQLGEIALEALRKKYGELAQFNERLRLVGLRGKENFQGALSNFDLLVHAQTGNFVFHTSGWGTGEIIEVSTLREQLTVEFENVPGRKHLTFTNAFKTIVPLQKEHFLARRFADPDLFEKEAKENPVGVIKILLRDLGPRTAAEIKDDLSGLVIPEDEWQKWWQSARAKLKKDTKISSPESLKEPFILRAEAITHEEQFYKLLKTKKKSNEILLACYNFVRDHAPKLKSPEVKEVLTKSLNEILERSDLNQAEKLQALFCLESVSQAKEEQRIKEIIQNLDNVEDFIEEIEILAYKKQTLVAIRQARQDWQRLFLVLFFHISQGALRDYLLKELIQSDAKEKLVETLKDLLQHPAKQPDLVIWYFQKITDGEKEAIPFADKEGQCQFMESFLLLLSQIENVPSYKELTKKMYTIFSAKRYALVRKILEGSSIEFAKEFLLLASKCHTLSGHDLKILRSLSEVAHPQLKAPTAKKGHAHADDHTIWTSEEGYLKIQDRIKHLGTKEIVDNAREIEAARALGDLRENSEYKYALERRSRLQGELKTLSDQLGKARVISPDDVHPEEVGVGSILDVEDSQGNKASYKILGPWDANPDENILSFQSKLAQTMTGLRCGDSFLFKGEEFHITNLRSIFDEEKK